MPTGVYPRKPRKDAAKSSASKRTQKKQGKRKRHQQRAMTAESLRILARIGAAEVLEKHAIEDALLLAAFPELKSRR